MALAIALLTAVLAAAPQPEFEWVQRFGGPGHDKTRGLAAGPDGRVYATGEFAGTIQFGRHTLTSQGELDFFVACFSSEGECLWASQGGGSRIDRGYAAQVDRQGNCYATGHFQSDDARFGAEGPLPLHGDYDIFVAKYDPRGKLLWIRTGGGKGYDYGHGLGVDAAGSCYVTGGLAGAGEFDGRKLDGGPASHLFLLKYRKDGALDWSRTSVGGSASGQGMAVDPVGNTWVAGSTNGTVDFGGVTLESRGRDAVLVRYGPDGKALWARDSGGSADGTASSVSVDSQGRSFLGGMFKGTVAFGREPLASAGEQDTFAAAFDGEGKTLWASAGGGPGIDYCLATAPDDRGGCFTVGMFHDGAVFGGTTYPSAGDFDLFLTHYDPQGKLAAFRCAGGSGGDLAYCIARAGQGNAYLSGAFSRSSTYGKTTLTSAGSNDVLLAKVRLP
jgi:hypothetical protein